MTEIESEKGDVAEPGQIASGAVYSNRIIPRATEPATGPVGAGETTIIFHEKGGDEPLFGPPEYTRSNALICEASRILISWNYLPAQIRKSPIPIDIIGVGRTDTLIIEIIRSRKPVPDAPALCGAFPERSRSPSFPAITFPTPEDDLGVLAAVPVEIL